MTGAEVSAAVERLREEVDDEQSKGAMEQAQYDHLRQHAEQVPDLDASLIQHQDAVRRLTEEVAQARRDRAALGNPAAEQDTCPCPDCGAQVAIVGRLLKVPTTLNRDALTQRLRQVAEAEGHVANRETAFWRL